MIKHNLRKGYDIKLAGKTEKIVVDSEKPKLFASQPPDFIGLKPRLLVEEGSQVKIGTSLYYDKLRPEVKFTSPTSGKVVQINRGERRAILEVVIESDDQNTAIDFGKHSADALSKLSEDDIKGQLLESGLWPVIRQRPFSKIANPGVKPRDIFICAMDTSPLAADPEFLLENEEENFQAGINVLKTLTAGKIYLTVDGSIESHVPAIEKAQNVEVHSFKGKHPAGNVSVHIHHISPIAIGDIVWYVYAADVVLIGRLFLSGEYPTERTVAVAGSSAKAEIRKYYKTRVGTKVQSLANEGNMVDDQVRYISGNVMSGRRISENGYLGFCDRTLTVIPDNRKRVLFGWLTPGFKDESFSRLFLSKIMPSKEYVKDTRIHGGKRAFIQTGEYEKVLPMDILPMHLVKSIMAEEIEDMLALGLLEVDEEDFALCSYICPSKIHFGTYIRQGLDVLEKEGG
jgi:Na+-transporting NADH:ubiquinone oxidoreductase subunit A